MPIENEEEKIAAQSAARRCELLLLYTRVAAEKNETNLIGQKEGRERGRERRCSFICWFLRQCYIYLYYWIS
jgi:hypothetical protein